MVVEIGLRFCSRLSEGVVLMLKLKQSNIGRDNSLKCRLRHHRVYEYPSFITEKD